MNWAGLYTETLYLSCPQSCTARKGLKMAETQTNPEGREVRLPDERTYYINIPIHPLTGQVLTWFLGLLFGIILLRLLVRRAKSLLRVLSVVRILKRMLFVFVWKCDGFVAPKNMLLRFAFANVVKGRAVFGRWVTTAKFLNLLHDLLKQ